MFACPVCGKVTFLETYWDNAQRDYAGNEYSDDEILYPVNSLKTKLLPNEIKNAFESALKVKNIDNDLCFIALRKTLELV